MRPPILSLLLSATLAAQSYVVDANDPGADFQTLTDAIAAVPAGATLLLRSDLAENGGDVTYTVDRDLTIVRDAVDPVTVRGQLWIGYSRPDVRFVCRGVNWDSSDVAGPVGTIVPWFPGSVIHLEDAVIHSAPSWGIPLRGAAHGGVLLLKHCFVLGDEPGFPAIENNSTGTVILQDCIVAHADPGDDAIVVTGGGDAYASGTRFLGRVFTAGGSVMHVLPDQLYLRETTLRSGGTLTILADGTPGGWSLLLMSIAVPSLGLELTEGWLLLGAPIATVPLTYDVTGSWRLSAPIPPLPGIEGTPLHFQALDFTTRRLSELESGVIGI